MSTAFEEPGVSFVNVLRTTFEGMRATAREALRPAVTEDYPRERPDLPWGAKGQLYLQVDDCIACFKCAQACPSNCIRIDAVRVKPGELKDTTDGHKRMFDVLRFEIDMGQCCYCGLCTGRSSYAPAGKEHDAGALGYADAKAACPSDCLNFYTRFENGSPDPGDLIYHFARHDFDQAKARWQAAEPKARRTTHPERAARDLENDS